MAVFLLGAIQGVCRGIDQFCLRNKMQVQTAGMKDEASGLLIWSREGPV